MHCYSINLPGEWHGRSYDMVYAGGRFHAVGGACPCGGGRRLACHGSPAHFVEDARFQACIVGVHFTASTANARAVGLGRAA